LGGAVRRRGSVYRPPECGYDSPEALTMNLRITPELQRFVDEQVKAGRFSSADEVVEAGLARLMLDDEGDVLDARDVAEIKASREQARAGNVTDWRQYSSEIRKRYPLD
jgi:putative addiction module CopG family antidote